MNSEASVEVLNIWMIDLDPESRGYDPYDNPGPAPGPSED